MSAHMWEERREREKEKNEWDAKGEKSTPLYKWNKYKVRLLKETKQIKQGNSTGG